MNKKKNKLSDIPKFKNEDEEREFWATHSVLDFPDVFTLVKLDLSRLKLSTQSVTVRLPQGLLSDLRILANKCDVPYQSLMKVFLTERIEQEHRAALRR